MTHLRIVVSCLFELNENCYYYYYYCMFHLFINAENTRKEVRAIKGIEEQQTTVIFGMGTKSSKQSAQFARKRCRRKKKKIKIQKLTVKVGGERANPVRCFGKCTVAIRERINFYARISEQTTERCGPLPARGRGPEI